MEAEASFFVNRFSPIALEFGAYKIPWYWISYFLGMLWVSFFTFYYQYKNYLLIKREHLPYYLAFGQLALILGGRIFYILAYAPQYFMKHPEKIFLVWEGGMSFHGAILGLGLSTLLFSRYFKESPWPFMDSISISAPLFLFFGRISNFIDGELLGRPSLLPWAVIFPHYDNIPRHPSQLYEAITEGLLIFAILWIKRFDLLPIKMKASSLFLILYGVFRFFVEFTRAPDPQLGYFGIFTMGQILCLVMIVIGLILFVNAQRSFLQKKEAHTDQ